MDAALRLAAAIEPGLTLCVARCGQPAVLALDERLLCLDCCEVELERILAIEREPRLRDLLPPLYDRP